MCLGVEVVKIVFAVANVVVVDALDDRAVAVVPRQIHVGTPPTFRRVALVAVQVVVEVGLVGRCEWTLIVEFTGASLHFVQVAVR